jgi:hypothetical protein
VAALVLVSTKGSPGVTTAAAALAAVAGHGSGSGLLAELDPSGGSVQVLAGGPAVWGLVDVGATLRRQADAGAVHPHLAAVPPGLAALLAPTAGHVAESVIGAAGDRWVHGLRAAAAHVVVDAGRWEPSQPTASRIAGADLVAVVCRPALAAIENVRLGLDQLRQAAGAPVGVVVVGRRPYAPAEIAEQLGVPLGGAVAWDPRGAAALWARGVSRAWLRSRLARSAAETSASLEALAAARTAGARV